MNRGIRVLQTLALPLGYVAIWESGAKDLAPDILCGAGDGARTRYLHLGKVALYQMSYARVDVQTQRTCAVLRTLRYALAAHVCVAELHKVGASGRN